MTLWRRTLDWIKAQADAFEADAIREQRRAMRPWRDENERQRRAYIRKLKGPSRPKKGKPRS